MAETLDILKPDPRNARRHSRQNIDQITIALQEVGAARSIVIDEDNVILAGNATVEAAKAAGLVGVRVVDVDGETIVAVRRQGLTPEQKRRLALFDNRAAELAEWDPTVLTTLAEDTDLAGLGDADELAVLLDQAPDVTFPAFDETAAEEVIHVTCPACGHRFPR